MKRRSLISIFERFATEHALQDERERKTLHASPSGEFISGAPDKSVIPQKAIFENEQVRVSTTSVPKGTDWSAPHDGRDRIVVLLDQINPLAQTNEEDSSSSAWRVTRIPANSDINVPNNSDQTKILMILEFKDTAVEESISLRSRSSLHDFNCRLHVQVSCPIFRQAVTHTRERCLLRSGHLLVEIETMFRVLRSHRFSINRLKLRRYLSTRYETLPPKLEVSFSVTRVP